MHGVLPDRTSPRASEQEDQIERRNTLLVEQNTEQIFNMVRI